MCVLWLLWPLSTFIPCSSHRIVCAAISEGFARHSSVLIVLFFMLLLLWSFRGLLEEGLAPFSWGTTGWYGLSAAGVCSLSTRLFPDPPLITVLGATVHLAPLGGVRHRGRPLHPPPPPPGLSGGMEPVALGRGLQVSCSHPSHYASKPGHRGLFSYPRVYPHWSLVFCPLRGPPPNVLGTFSQYLNSAF